MELQGTQLIVVLGEYRGIGVFTAIAFCACASAVSGISKKLNQLKANAYLRKKLNRLSINAYLCKVVNFSLYAERKVEKKKVYHIYTLAHWCFLSLMLYVFILLVQKFCVKVSLGMFRFELRSLIGLRPFGISFAVFTF